MKSTRLILLIVLAVALVSRIAGVLLLTNPSEPEGDIQHDMYARSLVAGNGFRIDGVLAATGHETPGSFGHDTLYSFKPPLYPLFLAGIYKTMSRNFIAVGIVQAILGMLTCLLVYRIGKRMFECRVGLLAAGILAVYPYHVIMAARVSDTTLFTLLMSLSVVAFMDLAEKPAGARVIGAGVTLGAGILCRSNMLFFAPLAMLWLLIRMWPDNKRAFIVATGTGVVMVLALLPWMARNYAVHGQFVLLGTNGGYTFWQSHNPFTAKYLRMGSDLDPIAFNEGIDWQSKGLDDLSEADQDHWFYQEGFRFISQHPFESIRLAGQKLWCLWGWQLYPDSGNLRKNALFAITYVPILVLGVVGLILSRRRWRSASLLWGAFLAFSLVYVVFYGKTIYRCPLDPFIIVFAAIALTRALDVFRHRQIQENQPC